LQDINKEIQTGTDEATDAEAEPPGRLKVGIAYNLKRNTNGDLPDAEAEFDDMEAIDAIRSAIEETGCTVVLYEATDDFPIRLAQNRPDIVFNISEGIRGRGREAQVPAILDFLGIPYTGSDETTLCVAMDKALTKKLVASFGVNTPVYRIVKSAAFFPENISAGSMPEFPVLVKPNTEGSSKGVSDFSVARDIAGLRSMLDVKIGTYRQDMLVEKYISGREFTVGILGNGNGFRVFPPMEIIFNDKNHPIYSYEVKRNFRNFVRYRCPPDLSPDLLNKITDAAKTVYSVLECRDLSRMDFRMSADGSLYFIEINPLPGLAPGYSDFPMIAGFCGIDYPALIRSILDSALARYGMPLLGSGVNYG